MLKNKIILLTGATDGIGKQTAFELAEKSAILLMHGKNLSKGLKIKDEIIAKTANKNIFYFNADFTSFKEIEKLSNEIHKQFSHIDILINNAGVFENEKVILKNGMEKTFMVNHLATFSLTMKLLDLLEQSKNARIINVSSMAHANSIDFENLNAENYYSGENAYSLSKLCNILFTYELDSKLGNKNITVNAVHPGVINTKLLIAGWGECGNSPDESAKHILYLADTDELNATGGKYFMNDKITKSTDISYNTDIWKKLWNISMKYSKTQNHSQIERK